MPADVDLEEVQQGADSGGAGDAAAAQQPSPQGATTPPPGAAGAPAAPAAAPAATPSAGRRIYNSVIKVLGGETPTRPAVDPATGKIVDQPIPRGEPGNKPGDFARHLIASALEGMSAAAEAPNVPGGGAARGIALGAGGAIKAQQEQRQRRVGEAETGFANQQAQGREKREAATAMSEDQLRAAQRAHLAMETTAQSFELNQKQLAVGREGSDLFNAYAAATDVPGTQQLGTFANMDEVIAYEKAHQDLTEHLGNGRIVTGMIVGPDGISQGVKAAYVPDDVQRQPLSVVFAGKDIPKVAVFVPGQMQKGGKLGPPTIEYHDASPNTKYGDFLNMNDAAADKYQKYTLGQASLNKEQADTAEANARTAQLKVQTAGLLNNGSDELGQPLPPMPVKERTERYDKFSKDYVEDAVKLEQSYSQMQNILARAGKGQMTGADSVVGLFNAIGISSASLKGKGFRINSNIVGEHVGARNVFQTAAARMSKLTPDGSGEVVTPKQLQDYTQILNDARHDLYLTMADEAARQGLPKDFLPRGNNKPLDLNTAKIFLDVYGGDKNLARTAAARFGWQIPAAAPQ